MVKSLELGPLDRIRKTESARLNDRKLGDRNLLTIRLNRKAENISSLIFAQYMHVPEL